MLSGPSFFVPARNFQSFWIALFWRFMTIAAVLPLLCAMFSRGLGKLLDHGAPAKILFWLIVLLYLAFALYAALRWVAPNHPIPRKPAQPQTQI